MLSKFGKFIIASSAGTAITLASPVFNIYRKQELIERNKTVDNYNEKGFEYMALYASLGSNIDNNLYEDNIKKDSYLTYISQEKIEQLYKKYSLLLANPELNEATIIKRLKSDERCPFFAKLLKFIFEKDDFEICNNLISILLTSDINIFLDPYKGALLTCCNSNSKYLAKKSRDILDAYHQSFSI